MSVAVALPEPMRVALPAYLWEVFRWDYLGSFRVNERIPGFRFSSTWWMFTAGLMFAAAGALWMYRRAR